MNTNKSQYISPEEYELLQPSYDCKTEYADGDIIMHSSASDTHNDIIVNISSEIRNFLKGTDCRVRIDGSEVIFDDEERYKFKPDIFIVCQKDKDSMKGQSYTTPPKIIFEVISPGKKAIKLDKSIKYDVYEKYGVLEYNFVEQNGFIIQHALIDDSYRIVNTYHSGDIYESYIFKGLKIDLNDIFE